ncbi:MAG: hypothetical protein ACLFUR_01705 [Candidatus Hadarchaeia archaeon]
MRGQSSVEALLVLAVVLSSVVGFLYFITGSSQETNALTAAREGAENAITRYELENGATVNLSEASLDDGQITISLKYWGPLDESSLAESVRMNALRYIYRTVEADYPSSISALDNRVSTSRHTFVIVEGNVSVEEVSK